MHISIKRPQKCMEEHSMKRQFMKLTLQKKQTHHPLKQNSHDVNPNSGLQNKCCGIVTDQEKKNETVMPKKYNTRKQKRLPRIEPLDESLSIPSQFTLKTFTARTTESKQNCSLWNIDSPVNKLYD